MDDIVADNLVGTIIYCLWSIFFNQLSHNTSKWLDLRLTLAHFGLIKLLCNFTEIKGIM